VTDGAAGGTTRKSSRFTLALAVFLLTTSLSGAVALTLRPLGYLGGLADTWYELGLNLALRGTFGIDADPTLYKPPGYPAFVAAVVRTAVGRVPEPKETRRLLPMDSDLALLETSTERGYLEAGARAVYLAQSVVLGAAAALLYLWLSTGLRQDVSLVSALVFGLNPYAVVHTGFLHYAVCHMFLLIAASWALQVAIDRHRILLPAGALWGVATLVRPVTLILPPFALVAFLVRRRTPLPRRILAWAVFVLGMGLVIGPYTLRNARLSGRFVPVNAQAWRNIWGATTEDAPIDPDHFRWKLLRHQIMEFEASVSGQSSPWGWEPYGVADNLKIEDAFHERAVRNLRADSGIYLRNAVRSAITVNLDIDSVLLQVFQHLQHPPVLPKFLKLWFWPGNPQDFEPPTARLLTRALFGVLTLLAAVGLVWGRSAFLLVPACVHATICVAHAITWMDFLYYYVKVPMLFVFAAAGLQAVVERAGRVGQVLLGLLLVATIALDVLVF
jgi:hypothetical protein